jgi:hypothetical protein
MYIVFHIFSVTDSYTHCLFWANWMSLLPKVPTDKYYVFPVWCLSSPISRMMMIILTEIAQNIINLTKAVFLTFLTLVPSRNTQLLSICHKTLTMSLWLIRRNKSLLERTKRQNWKRCRLCLIKPGHGRSLKVKLKSTHTSTAFI